MGAIKAPTIVGIKHNTDTNSADYTYLKVNGEPRTTQLRWADRSTLMAIGKYCNAFSGKGTPVGMDKSEMLGHVQVRIKELGEKNNYVPEPFMEPSPTAKVVLNSAQRQSEPKGSSIDDAVKQLMESMLASGVMTPPTTPIDPAQIEALQAQIDDLQLQVANRPAPVVIVNNGVPSKPTVGVVHAKYAQIAQIMALRANLVIMLFCLFKGNFKKFIKYLNHLGVKTAYSHQKLISKMTWRVGESHFTIKKASQKTKDLISS
jgi:hypothetical protein